MNPSSNQIGGTIRALLGPILVYAAAKGWISNEWIAGILSIGSVIATVVWSWYTNSVPAMVAAVAESDDVKKVIVTPALAMTTPSLKVVSSRS